MARYSFDAMSIIYERILKGKGVEHFPVVLVANKCDWEVGREVSTNGTHQ